MQGWVTESESIVQAGVITGSPRDFRDKSELGGGCRHRAGRGWSQRINLEWSPNKVGASQGELAPAGANGAQCSLGKLCEERVAVREPLGKEADEEADTLGVWEDAIS